MSKPASRAIAVFILWLIGSAAFLWAVRHDPPAGNPDGIELRDEIVEVEK